MAAAAAEREERKRKRKSNSRRMRKRKRGVSLAQLPMERKSNSRRTRKRKRGVSLAQLPDDLFINILSRLPTKSLFRFRCVSKNMRALVSNSRFMKLHCNQSTKTSPRLILKCGGSLIHTKSVFQVKDHDVPLTVLNCRSLENTRIVGACAGLVCFVIHHITNPFRYFFYLLNPSTGECNKLPRYNNVLSHINIDKEMDLHVGFGYDAINNEYKVIRMIKGDPSKESALVFSTRTQTWRNIQNHSVSNFARGSPSILLNGILHWLTGEIHNTRLTNLSLLSFDLSHEKFNKVPGPDDDDCCSATCKNLGVLRGCLCIGGMRISKSNEEFMLWMMKDYGVKESWTVLIRITTPELLHPICSMENGEILFLLKYKYLAVYNHPTNSFHKIRFPNLGSIYQAWMYEDSLIPPNGLSDVGKEEAIMPICLG